MVVSIEMVVRTPMDVLLEMVVWTPMDVLLEVVPIVSLHAKEMA